MGQKFSESQALSYKLTSPLYQNFENQLKSKALRILMGCGKKYGGCLSLELDLGQLTM